jgi:D-galactarolactone cycloisomerase
MKIVDVTAHLLGIPLRQTRIPANWSWGSFNQIIVEVRTDEGIVGYGESFGFGVPHATAAVIKHCLRPMLLGCNPTDICQLLDRMYRQTHIFGRYGITTFAISGVDIALWDIIGKIANQPLNFIFGAEKKNAISAYASLVRYTDLQQLKDVALQAVKDGYRGIKLHQLDLDSLRVVREAVGDDTRLMVDANCAWSREEAATKANQFKQYSIEWLEEPIWPPEDYDGLSELRKNSGIPVAIGETACTSFQFREILEKSAATYVQPSVVKVGGITEWRRVAALAESYNTAIAPHSPYMGPGLVATGHLIASTASSNEIEYLYAELEVCPFKVPLIICEGNFLIPTGPGLGVDIDSNVLKDYAVKIE